MNNQDIIDRLKNHPGINDDATVGIVSSFGKGAEVVAKEKTRDIVAILTTSDIDMDDEVLVPSGADMSYLQANKMIFADHHYNMTDYVGVLRSITPMGESGNLKGWRIRFHASDSDLGNACVKIVEHAGQIGISAGFRVKNYGPPTQQELDLYSMGEKTPKSIVRQYMVFEASTTCIPCNVACQGVAAGIGTKAASIHIGKGVDMINTVDDLVTRGMIKRETAYLLGLPIDLKRSMHAVSSSRSKTLINYMPDGVAYVVTVG